MSNEAIRPGLARSIKTLVEKYLRAFPKERDRLKGLLSFLAETEEGPDLYSRKNFVGHITASGLVLSPDRNNLLFINHKYLNRFLQPGGHVDQHDETIFAAAQREIREETGQESQTYIPFHLDYYLPIDIDTHDIPANPRKAEPKHVHHDFRFLFRVDSDVDLNAPRETDDGQLIWIDLENAGERASHSFVIEKVRIALSQEFLPRQFFRRVAELANYRNRCSSVAVTHILPDVLSYLQALSSVTYVQAVIPKPKSIVAEIKTNLEKEFPLVELSRMEISAGERLFEILDTSNDDFILFDIGGYFAPVVNRLVARYQDRFLGVIEDTENGQQKYEKAHELEPLEAPVISVARSPLKETEDFLVGQSVLFSADAILRECGLLVQYVQCAVLGFGKIGRSICHHLLLRGIKPHVFDSDPIKRVHAQNQLYDTPEKDVMLKEAAVLFSATGSRAMDVIDFRQLKDGCFVFSVTSSDDEFDTRFLGGEYQQQEIAPSVYRYARPDHHFYLVNQGNAVNFIHKAVLGSFIHLVRAEMIYGGACLVRREFAKGISQLTDEQRTVVAQTWLDIFNPGRRLSTHFEVRDRQL